MASVPSKAKNQAVGPFAVGAFSFATSRCSRRYGAEPGPQGIRSPPGTFARYMAVRRCLPSTTCICVWPSGEISWYRKMAAAQVAWNRFRLLAQLKAAVEQLDILILSFEDTSLKIAKNSWPETQAKGEFGGLFQSPIQISNASQRAQSKGLDAIQRQCI